VNTQVKIFIAFVLFLIALSNAASFLIARSTNEFIARKVHEVRSIECESKGGVLASDAGNLSGKCISLAK
jgi:hypothetical protein